MIIMFIFLGLTVVFVICTAIYLNKKKNQNGFIQKNDKNKAILKAYVSIDYLDNENELKYFNSNIETIYAVNEGNRILNYYIDAVTAQRQENEDYIEQYKDYSTQTIDEVELKLKAKALGKLLLDTQNLKHPNYRDIQNSIMSIFPSAKYKGCVDIYRKTNTRTPKRAKKRIVTTNVCINNYLPYI